MSVDQIYRDFQALAASGAISGDAPEGLADLLRSLNVSSLTIAGTQAFVGADSAWLTATVANFRNTAWDMRLTGQDGTSPAWPPSRAKLSLTLTARSQAQPWTFAQAFPAPQLPKTRRAVDRPGGGLILGRSVIAPLVVDQLALTAANLPEPGTAPPARLQGWLQLAGSDLAPYIVYFGSDRLWAEGTVDFTNPDLPQLLLEAPAPGAQLNFGALQLSEAGLRLWTGYPDPYPLPAPGARTSAALVYGRFTADTTPPQLVDLSAPLLNGDHVWPLYALIAPPLTVSGGARLLSTLIVGSNAGNFTLPPGLAALDLFGLQSLEFGVFPPNALGKTLAYSSITIVSTTPWYPPIPFVSFENVGVTWSFDWFTAKTLVTATIFGTMVFGAKPPKRGGTGALVTAPPEPPSPGGTAAAKITVRLDLPELGLAAYNVGDIDIPIADAFAAYFGSQPAEVPSVKITGISVDASFLRQTYQAALTIDSKWPLSAGPLTFNLDEIELQIAVTQNAVSGLIMGTVAVTPQGGTPFRVVMSAAYPGTGHWEFEIGLVQGPIKLVDFVAAFLGSAAPAWLADFQVNIADFYGFYSTDSSAGNPYRMRCKVEVIIDVLGTRLSLSAAADIERKSAATEADRAMSLALRAGDAQTVTVGSLAGSFSILRITVTAQVSFNEKNEKTWQFSIAYGDLTLSAVASKTADNHDILTVRLKGATLGSVTEYLVNLANPNANFRLAPPWDFLNSIDLGRFALVIDRTADTVTLTYDLNLTLPFISIEQVGLRYDRSSGTPRVSFVIRGQFLGNDYRQQPLEWDAVNESPPAIPGQGQQLFDLRYLGVGQHVTLRNLTSYTSISEVIDKLRGDMLPPKDPKKVPLGPQMRFDAASQWMLGLDCTVMETVTLKLVLHDPDLYGVLLSLAGPDAGSLAGLSFELLYKKVTDTVGVFHVRLQVPNAFRQLQFGVVSVTLGIVTVDIYTNGNFRVDLGFPHNRDFSDSFAVEVEIFNGMGGLYFGLLDGATSTRVPRITNGTFSPVIELGVGLAVGVGRTFEKGPLKAGLYLDVLVIFEGTLAWFHPNDVGRPTAMYYWCRGSAGLIGKLYGSVDFKIISVSVSIEAYAIATLTLAAYEATLIELDVGVNVNATVHILFISVSFTFGLTINASFQVGSASPPPWTLAQGASSRNQALVAHNAFTPVRRRRADVAAHTRAAFRQMRLYGSPLPNMNAAMAITRAAETGDGYHLHFDPTAHVFPDQEIRVVKVKIVPAFTVADVPVKWDGQPPPPANPTPHYRIAFLLMADTAVPPAPPSIVATHKASVALNAHAQTSADTSFGQVAEGMLRWSLNALGVQSTTATVTLGQLEELVEQLALPEAANEGFSWPNLQGFFTNNLSFTLSGIPAGNPGSIGGVVFPMFPPLEWTSPDLQPPDNERHFWEYQPVDTAYEQEISTYFSKLEAGPPDEPPEQQQGAAAAVGDATESMATFVFRDYFAMVARTTAQTAVNLLSAFPHEVSTSDSLALIAGGFPTTNVAYIKQPDDTADQVARFYGMSVTELLALNGSDFPQRLAATPPGNAIQVTLGVTPESIADRNPDWPVTADVPLALGDLVVQIGSQETVAIIASKYGLNVDTWLQASAVLDAQGLLRAGSTIALTAFVYANPNALPIETVAAVYYTRLPMLPAGTTVPLAEWYAERIVALNPNVVWESGPVTGAIAVPAAYDSSGTTTWNALPGDTLTDIASYFALMQNVVAGSDYAAWLQAVQTANTPLPPTGVALPAQSVFTILPDDTLTSARLRMLLDPAVASQAQTFRDLVKGADILTPLAQIAVLGVNVRTGPDLTLLRLAQTYGLPLEDLAMRVAPVTGLLATSPDKKLFVPNVPAMALADLVAALHDPAIAATVAGQIARFMLHGLRLPAPVTGTMTGVYELIGQQVPGPAPIVPPPPPPTPTVLTLNIEKGQTADWLTFADSIATDPGDTLTGLRNRYPSLHALNPAITHRAGDVARMRAEAGLPQASTDELPAGMIVLTQTTNTLVVTLTNDQLSYPDTGLLPAIQGTITALPLFREVAVRHPVTHVIPWQTTVAPLLPAAPAASAMPSLWLLPADLMATAASGMSTAAYQLMQIPPHAAPSVEPAELTAYAWGMVVDIVVRQIPGLRGTVEVLGADTADRQRLALLLEYLEFIPRKAGSTFPPPPASEQAHIRLLWQLPPSAGRPPGLTSTALDAAATFLVKCNLSTETHSGPRVAPRALTAVAPTAGPYFASIGDANAARFLALMWECSVVGGGGYWLHYEGDGAEIPQSIFDQDGLATFSLLVELESQATATSQSWPVRNLFAFNNCAVVGDGVDPGSIALFAMAENDAELTRAATVPPGQVGFTLDITNPGAAAPSTPQAALQQLYSLVGYQLAETSAFNASSEGQPLGPQVKTNADGTLDETVWHLSRIVPISRFARQSFLPSLPQLPPVAEDPYAGISSTDPQPTLADTLVALWFHDVLGNASQMPTLPPPAKPPAGAPSDTPNPLVQVPVGYTDPVIGPGGWPSTTLNFMVGPSNAPPPAPPLLTVSIALQGAAYQPAAYEPGTSTATKAARNAGVFASVYYQLMQPDVHAALLTTLQQAQGADPDVCAVSISPLRNFVTGAYVLLTSLSSFQRYTPDASLALTLDGICSRFGVNYDSIGAANAGSPLQGMLATTTLAIPQMAVFAAGDSVTKICNAHGSGLNPAEVLADPDNIVLPLMPATAIVIPSTQVSVPADALSVNDLLSTFNCTLDDLVSLNQGISNLLPSGFQFEYNGFAVEVGTPQLPADAQLVQVAQAFQSLYSISVSPTQVVASNAGRQGMFRSQAALKISSYIVRQGETLAQNGTQYTAAVLAPLNTNTINLFPIGTPLFLTTAPASIPAQTTLGDFAATQGVSAGNLLRHNGSATLAANTNFATPGLCAWPASLAGVLVPYTVRPGDTLVLVAARFVDPSNPPNALTAQALALLNADLPGTVTGGTNITIGTQTVQTQPGDSFNDVCNRFNPPVILTALIDAIQQTPGVLATGALLFAPPGLLGVPQSVPSGLTPAEAAGPFGLTASELLGANSGIPDLIVPAQALRASTIDATTEETTAADSLTAIFDRFRRRGITTSIDDLIAANAGVGFLRAHAIVLVPPATASLSQPLGTVQNGALTFKFPNGIFPIHVWLQIARNFDLVNPDLRGTPTAPSQAVLNRTAIAAARQGMADDRPDGDALTLVGFATQLEGAMPGVRVATGKVLQEQQESGGTDVWAVAFTDTWIKQVSVTAPLTVAGTDGPQPRCFALRPLSNTLVARQNVTLQLLDPATGALTGEEIRNYQGIDLEVWARSFLADVDLVLSAAYAAGAYVLNSEQLQSIIATKKGLAGYVARGLDYVLQGEAPGNVSPSADANRAAATEVLRQELLISLSRGYETSAVVQYDSSAQSTWTSTYARLSGKAVPQLSAQDPKLKAMTLSNCKVPLQAGSAPVSFVVDVPDVEAHEALPMELSYHVVELEFAITDEFEGYEKSDWLKFVNPVASGSPAALSFQLGTPTVPLPLRAYPPMPVLLDHHARVPAQASTLDQAVKWSYELLLRQQSTDQDEIHLQVDFNTALGLDDPQPSASDDLFAQLAQYTAVSAPLMSILAELRDWKNCTLPERLKTALQTYATLASNVAGAWNQHWQPSGAPPERHRVLRALRTGPVAEVYEFVITLQAGSNPGNDALYYKTLKLLRTQNARADGAGWPDITCITADGQRHTLVRQTEPGTCGCEPGEDCACYAFTDDVAAFVQLDFDITFPDLHIASYQSATAKVWLSRNAALLGSTGAATTQGFVYQTPQAGYAEPVVPFINIGDRVPLGRWSYDPVAGPLPAMFATLFDGDSTNRTIACGVRYGYQLAAGNPPDVPPLETYLPAKQSTAVPYTSSTAADITSALQGWADTNVPASTGGCWAFWINLYSSLDPTLPRPLLQLKHLVSPLS